MRLLQIMGAAGALVVAGLAGGTLINAVSADHGAAHTGDAPLNDLSGEYCDLYVETLAGELGVETEAIAPAARSAATSVIDSMVANGDLPSDVGERITERLATQEGTPCALLGGRFHHAPRHAARVELRSGMLDAAATALGLERDGLRDEMAGGTSLREVAEAEGVEYAAVSEAVLASARADLDAAVAAGRLEREHADSIEQRIEEWLAQGGQPHRRTSGD